MYVNSTTLLNVYMKSSKEGDIILSLITWKMYTFFSELE